MRDLNDLAAKWDPAKVDGALRGAISEVGGKVLAAAKKNTPPPTTSRKLHPYKPTGHLRRNWKTGQPYKKNGVYAIDVQNNVEYAPYVDLGHRVVHRGKTVGYVPPQNITKKAIDTVKPQINAIIKKHMRDVFS